MQRRSVALKVEKADKSKKILLFEYQVLRDLQGLPNVCITYEFVESAQSNGLNFIVMQMLGIFWDERENALGKNLATVKKQKGKDFTTEFAMRLLVSF